MEHPGHCENCGTELRGPYCYACGQPVKGMVRHLKSIVHDVLDTVFEYDSRVWRSLIPLYFRPGRITLEFLDGRRVRFVLPFRLFFLLTVISFLVIQLVAEPTPEIDPMLLGEPAAPAESQQADAEPGLRIDGERWDPVSNPYRVDWLPEAANQQINVWLGQAQRNVQRAAEEPGRIFESFLNLMPAALFVLMPVFALLLKLFYIRRGWFYTAHLVVALHSHSFLALALLVNVLLGGLAAAAEGLWLALPLELLLAVSRGWIPVYLLLMQKRVYGQSWWVTVPKYLAIGTAYTTLVGMAMIVVAIISVVVA